MAPNFLALATTLENLGARWLLAKKVNFMPWINNTEQIIEELPNFTISLEQHLAMFWPAKAMNPNENDSNDNYAL